MYQRRNSIFNYNNHYNSQFLTINRLHLTNFYFPSVNRKNEFLPIIQNDFLKTRLADLEEVTKDTRSIQLDFNYSPISIGKLRLMLHVEHALQSLRQLGFAKKDVDEVKGIFSDTNVYLLCGTIFVGSIHVS